MVKSCKFSSPETYPVTHYLKNLPFTLHKNIQDMYCVGKTHFVPM